MQQTGRLLTSLHGQGSPTETERLPTFAHGRGLFLATEKPQSLINEAYIKARDKNRDELLKPKYSEGSLISMVHLHDCCNHCEGKAALLRQKVYPQFLINEAYIKARDKNKYELLKPKYSEGSLIPKIYLTTTYNPAYNNQRSQVKLPRTS